MSEEPRLLEIHRLVVSVLDDDHETNFLAKWRPSLVRIAQLTDHPSHRATVHTTTEKKP